MHWSTNKNAPIRTTEHIHKCVEKLNNNSKIDSVSI